jgi:glycyl-tRNA synthetase (class II)
LLPDLDRAEVLDVLLSCQLSVSAWLTLDSISFCLSPTFFLNQVGVKKEHLRFRQHLPTEMAHYACDCWDAEIEVSTGWMETVGIADRSAYDLTVHAEKTKVDLFAQEKLENPVTVEVVSLAKKAGALVGKDFKKDGTGEEILILNTSLSCPSASAQLPLRHCRPLALSSAWLFLGCLHFIQHEFSAVT